MDYFIISFFLYSDNFIISIILLRIVRENKFKKLIFLRNESRKLQLIWKVSSEYILQKGYYNLI